MRKLVGEEALAYARKSGAQLYHHNQPVDLATAAQELLEKEPGALSCDAAPPLPPLRGVYLRVGPRQPSHGHAGQRRGCVVATGDRRARR